jgi:nicotinamidase-related amidase
MCGMDNTALLVIDIQDSFKTVAARWAQRNNPALEANVGKLLRTWRETSRPIFFFLHTDSDPGFRPTDPGFRLMDFLGRRDDEPLLVKSTRNAFSTTDLRTRLDALGVRKLAVCGITTEQCCETTTRVANDVYGYEVDFISDATATFPIGDLAADEIVRRTEAVLRGRFARIVTTEDVAEEVTASAR